MLLVKLAFRNVLRNKRRSILSAIAIGLGLASLIFVDSVLIGMKQEMIDAATRTFLGHAEIHARNFKDDFDVARTIPELDKLRKAIKSEPAVRAFSERVVFFGMVSSPENSASVMVYGIHPQTEKQISIVDDAIIEGNYLPPSNAKHKILIGEKLAQTLRTGLGKRLIITAANQSGDLAQEMFRVYGIFRTGIRELDSRAVFIGANAAQQMLGIDGVHEIVLLFQDARTGTTLPSNLTRTANAAGGEVEGWNQLIPELYSALSMFDFITVFALVLLFGVVALTIVNTMFMAIQERIYEFGIMRAVGTSGWQMGSVVVLEAVGLGILSSIMGALIGAGLQLYTLSVGINYKGLEFAGVTVQNVIYPVVTVSQYTLYPLIVLGLVAIVAIYPAVVAAKITPARAMRRSL